MGKPLNDEQIKYLMSIEHIDLTKSTLKRLFANYKSAVSMFEPEDTFELDLYGKEKIKTTVGRYIYNLNLNDKKENSTFYRVCGYINKVVDDKYQKEIDDKMGYALTNDDISADEMIWYIDRRDWLAYVVVSLIAPSQTLSVTKIDPTIDKKKEELFKQYEKELESNTLSTMAKIEGELLPFAKNVLKDDPGMMIYQSGARGSFNNNYKLTTIMRGLVKDNEDPTKVHLLKSNLVGGIQKHEVTHYNNVMVAGGSGRAIETRQGGYLNKIISANYQTVQLADKGTDCKSKKTLDFVLTEVMVKRELFLMRYIIEGGKPVMLTKENISNYIGKRIHMRTPMYCTMDDYCNVCAGELFYKFGIKNIGLLFSRPAGIILNISMKAFHDSTVKISKVNVFDFIEKV